MRTRFAKWARNFSKRTNRRIGSTHDRTSKFSPKFEVLEQRCLLAADVILEWNDVMLTANAADHSFAAPEQGGPVLTARAFAMVSAAMYDAFNSIERMGEPLLIRAKVQGEADRDAAVAQAAHDTLFALFPSQQARFATALNTTLARIPDGSAEDRGRIVGTAVAQAVLDARADDGVSELMEFNAEYEPKGLTGFHAVDPMNPQQGFYAPGAMHVAPFVVDDMEVFESRRLDDGTPEGRMEFLSSEEYRQAYEEVLAMGGDGSTSATTRTEEQTQIGIYWGYDGRPGLGTPPRLYNQIARTVASQQDNSVADNARLFALLNIAQSDAGLAAWSTKYRDDFWRPIMGIRYGDADGNSETPGNATWIPLGAPASNPRAGEINFTPPFPAYTSGHATFGAAVFQTLERFYGRDDIQFSFISDEFNGLTRDADGTVRPLLSRTFDRFSQAKFENGQSRIYLGIHWAFDRDDGIQTGDEVADYIFDSVLRPNSAITESVRHNAFDPHDVNDDGGYTALDALLVINAISVISEGTGSTNYVDVNRDGLVSALDALQVINRLSISVQSEHHGEGEAVDVATTFVTWSTPRGVSSDTLLYRDRTPDRGSASTALPSSARFPEQRAVAVNGRTVPLRLRLIAQHDQPIDSTIDLSTGFEDAWSLTVEISVLGDDRS